MSAKMLSKLRFAVGEVAAWVVESGLPKSLDCLNPERSGRDPLLRHNRAIRS